MRRRRVRPGGSGKQGGGRGGRAAGGLAAVQRQGLWPVGRGSAGIRVVLATPTAAPPIWLTKKHPEILPVDDFEEVSIHRFMFV